jgi:FKBP-type peptidyl-prolyl cis-trans isomerase
MAATKFQQIGIWTIAITLTIGTIGSFVAIILANDNARIDEAVQQEEYARQLADFEKQQAEAAKANAASAEPLEGYSAAPFDGTAVTDLTVNVLVEGTGPEVSSTDSISASYFGWLQDGTIFDSSNKKDADDAPVTFPLSGVIAGWTEGLAGQKVGSVVELTIPAEKAYGPNGSGVIPANAPLKFIVIIQSIEPQETP